MIAFDRPYAFIHINKCGGTSVEAALGLPKIHDTAMQRRNKIGANRWARTKTFSIVRHPFTRVSSLYRYRVRTNQTRMREKPIQLNEWIGRVFCDKDPFYHDKPLMFLPCVDWLIDEEGKIMVDLVLRLEEVKSDWKKVEALIGQIAPLPKLNMTNERAIDGANEFSSESRSILQEYFARDFEYFGYHLPMI